MWNGNVDERLANEEINSVDDLTFIYNLIKFFSFVKIILLNYIKQYNKLMLF